MQKRVSFGIFVLLTLLHTWPLASAPWRESLNHNADVQYAEWSMSWMARSLLHDPSALFDGNIFAPDREKYPYILQLDQIFRSFRCPGSPA